MPSRAEGRDAAGLTATSVVILATGFLGSVILARLLGPAGRGEVAAALLWPSLLVYIGSMGVTPAVLYFSGSSRLGAAGMMSTAMPLGAFQALVAAGIGFLAMPLLLDGQTQQTVSIARFALLLLPFGIVTLYGATVLQSASRISEFNLVRSVVPVGYFIAVVALGVGDAIRPRYVVAAYVSVSVCALFVALAALRHARLLQASRPQRTTVSALMRYGMKAQLGEIFGLATFKLDQVLMAALLPGRSLGLYVAALSVSQILSTWSATVRTMLPARLINEEGVTERALLIEHFVQRYLRVAVPTTGVLMLCCPIAVGLVYGQSFRESAPTAVILLAATLVLGLKDLFAAAAQAVGDPWTASQAELVGVVITVAMLPPLVTVLGIEGAAWASLTAYTFQAGFLSYKVRRRYGVSLRRSLGRASLVLQE